MQNWQTEDDESRHDPPASEASWLGRELGEARGGEHEAEMPQRVVAVPPWILERLPFILFVLTCATTLDLGGPLYSLGLMSILLFHEAGHYLQARRYGVPTTLPYFLPLPGMVSPFGTLGAVLAMRSGAAQNRALFDIAVSGPLAGLVPALTATFVGLHWSEVVPAESGSGTTLGVPLVFRWAAEWLVVRPEGYAIVPHPLAYAGWVGLLVTALNLFPVGQLDGGHILFALAPRWAHRISRLVVAGAWLWMLHQQYWIWTVMLLLLGLMGLRHPPVRPGGEPIGWGRRILGWVTLASILLIFTPRPFEF